MSSASEDGMGKLIKGYLEDFMLEMPPWLSDLRKATSVLGALLLCEALLF